jgi:hypothetical protein
VTDDDDVDTNRGRVRVHFMYSFFFIPSSSDETNTYLYTVEMDIIRASRTAKDGRTRRTSTHDRGRIRNIYWEK